MWVSHHKLLRDHCNLVRIFKIQLEGNQQFLLAGYYEYNYQYNYQYPRIISAVARAQQA